MHHVRRISIFAFILALRNPNYHQAGDTADTLDYARMAKVVRAVHAVATRF